MSKLITLAAFGAGYVLGARAGHDRYDQIAAASRRVASDPRVQRAGSKAADAAKEGAVAAAATVADKVRSDSPGDPGSSNGTASTTS